MKTTLHPASSTSPGEEDIRAYAEHLFEQSGRIPNRDLDNWLEAKTCLETNVSSRESHVRRHRHLPGRRRPGTVPRGFTMPASDSSLWIAKTACEESTACALPTVGDESKTSCPTMQ